MRSFSSCAVCGEERRSFGDRPTDVLDPPDRNDLSSPRPFVRRWERRSSRYSTGRERAASTKSMLARDVFLVGKLALGYNAGKEKEAAS